MLVYSFYLICGSLCCYIACMFLLPNKLLLGQKIMIFAYILLVSCFIRTIYWTDDISCKHNGYYAVTYRFYPR